LESSLKRAQGTLLREAALHVGNDRPPTEIACENSFGHFPLRSGGCGRSYLEKGWIAGKIFQKNIGRETVSVPPFISRD
jgi:hypothetical protein